MSDDVEVSITVPEDEVDTSTEETAVAAGEARAHAEHAVELAEEASGTAAVAETVAETSLETSYNVADDLALTRSELEALRVSNVELTENVNRLATLVAGIAEIQIASVSPSNDTTKPPRDEAPESRHWLDKKVF